MSGPSGLTSGQARELRSRWGPNALEERREGPLGKLLHSFRSPASLMLLAASGLSLAIGRSFDASFIAALLALNIGVGLWQEGKADRALEELRKKLATSARVLRDGTWRQLPSTELVPGDFVECGVGALVPADLKLLEANNLSINEAVLTGESLPKEKAVGDTAYSGSAVVTGLLRGEVAATGNRAFFGKIATSGRGQRRRSKVERDILAITRYLITAALIAVCILSIAFYVERQPLADTLILDLSLLIAGVPVSLPTVMTLILSLGAVALAQRGALTRRLASLEDFANVTLLLTDKTGTLTRNDITVERVRAYGVEEERLLALAGAAASPFAESALDGAIARRGAEAMVRLQGSVGDFTPADSIRKRITALVLLGQERYLVAMGMPRIVRALCARSHDSFERDVEEAGASGARAVAVALKRDPAGLADERGMTLAGLFMLSDPLRDDAAETLRFLQHEGVSTVMVTGDTRETAAHVVGLLGMRGEVTSMHAAEIQTLSAEALRSTAAFAEVLPDDKLALVARAQKGFTVASAGDGVNDLPAVRAADIGLAVANAVDALKGTADIVFLEPGIAVMREALIEARRIFFRLYNYSVYRISESLRLVVTTLVLGLMAGDFPLTPIEIIMLAFLNDIPIITLAFDNVKRTNRPADLRPKERFMLGSLYGLVGVANSIIFYILLAYFVHEPLPVIQTAFFLKLTVSGHLLIYVAHTRERWWRYLPHWSVIAATTATQALATFFAVSGIFVTPLSPGLALFVWVWAAFWMQVSEVMKEVDRRLEGAAPTSAAPYTAAAR